MACLSDALRVLGLVALDRGGRAHHDEGTTDGLERLHGQRLGRQAINGVGERRERCPCRVVRSRKSGGGT